MEQQFIHWLEGRGYVDGTVNSYSQAIHLISQHYSEATGNPINIYAITDQAQISQIAHAYSQAGMFSAFGYEQHGRFRAAISRYSEFFVHNRDAEDGNETPEVEGAEPDVIQTNFAYERDLQTTLCAQISELFPGYRIFGNSSLGIEYSIGGRRIDVLLEHLENGNLLVVELKSGVADYRVFGQVSMYMGLLQRQFAGKDISGVIVAGSIDDSLRQACETTSRITLKIYRMSLELEDI